MQIVSHNNTSPAKIELTVEVSVDELEEKYLTPAAQALSTKNPPKGFRPGRVDRKTARDLFGEVALYEASLDSVVRHTLPRALQELKINIVGQPDISIMQCAPGNPIRYKATADIQPTVTLGPYKDIKIEKRDIKIEDKEVKNTLEHLRQVRATEILIDRVARKEDRVIADIQFYMDTIPMDGGRFTDHSFVLGDDELWKGFNDNIVGMRGGEKKEFSLTLPQTHTQKNIAGKTVDFKVAVKQIFERTAPALDDAFAKTLGPFNTLSDVKKALRENMYREKEAKEKERGAGEILNKIIDVSTFSEIPTSIINHESRVIVEENKEMVKRQGMEWNTYLEHLKKTETELFEGVRDAALSRIKKNLILSELVKEKNITIENDELVREWDALKARDKSIVRLEQEDKGRTDGIKQYLKRALESQKVLQKLLSEHSV